jgi:uncharacterized protein (DUF362 family)
MSRISIQKISARLEQSLHELLKPFADTIDLRDRSVLIKPNLVEPEPWTTGQTTNPELVEAMVQWCRRHGARKIAIGEGPSYFQPQADLAACFTKTGIAEVARRQGIDWILFDDHPFRTFRNYSPRLPELFAISEHAFSWDHIINIPVPKPHYLTTVSIAMKNLKGFIKREHKPLFHHSGTQGIHGAITELNLLIRPSLTIVDGTAGVQCCARFLIAGIDPVAVDTVVAALMGYNPHDIATIRLGAEAGIGEMDLMALEISGDDLKDLSLNIEQPLDFLRRAFPLLTLHATTACSGCLIPLFAALRACHAHGIQPRTTTTLAAGPAAQQTAGAVCIGRCAQPSSPSQPWLRACPPGKEETYAFLKTVLRATT